MPRLVRPLAPSHIAPSSGAAAAHAILGALSFVFRSAPSFQREDGTVDGMQSDPPLARRSPAALANKTAASVNSVER